MEKDEKMNKKMLNLLQTRVEGRPLEHQPRGAWGRPAQLKRLDKTYR